MTQATVLLLALFASFCSAGACFANKLELIAAVDDYAVNLTAGSSSAMSYGFPIGTWCVSSVSDMSQLFSQQRNPNMSAFNPDVSAWDVSHVSNMMLMFQGSSFAHALSGWNVSNVVNMREMFRGTRMFNHDISSWDVSRVTNMRQMFGQADVFNQDISGWDVSNVQNMRAMFIQAFAFNQDLSRWDVSSVTDISGMLSYTLFNYDVSGWDVSSVLDMSGLFNQAAPFNQDVSGWNVSSVTDMGHLFRQTAFNHDISGWDVSSVTDMAYMFYRATAFNQDLSSWDVANVQDTDSMFRQASAFNQDLSSWDVSSVVKMDRMFNAASSWHQNLCSWGPKLLSSAPSMLTTFSGTLCSDLGDPNFTATPPGPFCRPCAPLTCIPTRAALLVAVDDYLVLGSLSDAVSSYGPIQTWCFSGITDLSAVFSTSRGANVASFNDDISAWNTGAITDMSDLFNGATAFNQDLSSWDLTSVTSMDRMFRSASSFNQDLCSWGLQLGVSPPNVSQLFFSTDCDNQGDPSFVATPGPFCQPCTTASPSTSPTMSPMRSPSTSPSTSPSASLSLSPSASPSESPSASPSTSALPYHPCALPTCTVIGDLAIVDPYDLGASSLNITGNLTTTGDLTITLSASSPYRIIVGGQAHVQGGALTINLNSEPIPERLLIVAGSDVFGMFANVTVNSNECDNIVAMQENTAQGLTIIFSKSGCGLPLPAVVGIVSGAVVFVIAIAVSGALIHKKKTSRELSRITSAANRMREK